MSFIKKHAWALAFCLAACGCFGPPRLKEEEARAKLEEAVKAAPQTISITKIEMNRSERRADVQFEIPELVNPQYEARFFHRDYRGWELEVVRDRFGGWVPAEYVKMDLGDMRRLDAAKWVYFMAMAIGEAAFESGHLPAPENWREAIAPLAGKYLKEAQGLLYFRAPSSWPASDPWGHPYLVPTLEIHPGDMIPLNFGVVSAGPNGEPGDGDDVYYNYPGESLFGAGVDHLYYHQ